MKKIQLEDSRNVIRKREYYNLDMIISISFRVNSKTAIKFRTWANKLIKEYIELFNNQEMVEAIKYCNKVLDYMK